MTRSSPAYCDAERERALRRIVAVIREGKDFLLTTHEVPDGDGIGSCTALAWILEALGKRTVCFAVDPVPYNLSFLPGVDRFVSELPDDRRFDATFIVDAGDLTRCFPHGPPVDRLGVTIVVDHHLSTRLGFADVELVDAGAAATGLHVREIAAALGIELPREAALGIYVSIVSDTGNFRYSNTDPRALRVAAEMLEAGVDPWEVTACMQEQQPATRWRLLARVLASLEIPTDGRIAALTVRRKWMEELGATRAMAGGFVEYARAVDGVEVAVLFHEAPEPEVCWLSFSSRGRINVARIAEVMGGGGHHNAAGAELSGPLSEIRERVFAEVRAAIQEAGIDRP